MTQLPGQFNASQHQNMRTFEVIPNSWYHLLIEESEIKLTKKAEENNNPALGQMLVLKIKVMDGPYQGRYIWWRLNIINQNPEAQKIANEGLATLCRALGFSNGLPDNDTVHLHGKPFDGLVKIVKGEKGYNDQNDIGNCKKYGTENIDTNVAQAQNSGGNAAVIDTPQTAQQPQQTQNNQNQNAGGNGTVW